MENRIIIEERRDFGDIISDGYIFLKENLAPISKAYFTYVVPLMILVGYTYSKFFSKLMDNIVNPGDMFSDNAIFLVTFIVSSLFGYLLLYLIGAAGFFSYTKEKKVLDYDYIQKFIGANFIKALIGFGLFYLLIIGLIIIMVALMAVSVALGSVVIFFGLVFIVYMSINWSFFMICMLDDNIGFAEGLKASGGLVKDNWWPTLGVLFVASLIVSLLSQVVSLPLGILTGLSALSGIESGAIGDSSWITTAVFIIVFIITTYMQLYTLSCSFLKYYDLKVKKFGGNLKDDIETFGEENDSIFENKGEY